MNRFVVTFQRKEMSHPIITYNGRPVCTEWSLTAAKEKASWLNHLLDLAHDEGREDAGKEIYQPEDEEDEAPLIDVPEGSDEPDYGPEKIPPRPVHKLTVDELPKHKPDI